MRLHNLTNNKGARKTRKRLGCGPGTGQGKTAGKGHKGDKARSGGRVRPGFEGGQMPLYRRLPHRGFSNARFRIEFDVVNVGDLAKLESSEIDRITLLEAGLIRKAGLPLKVLADGELNRSIVVYAEKFSKQAKDKIESLGGKAIVVTADCCDDASCLDEIEK